MAVNPIPPQAYTKDTMLRAYSWLQNQSLQIREMATTPDILVSLYLKTTRDGEGALDRPSIQNFKNELRSLAGLMGELESGPAVTQPPPLASQSSPPSLQVPQSQVHETRAQAANPPPKKTGDAFVRGEEPFFTEVSGSNSSKLATNGGAESPRAESPRAESPRDRGTASSCSSFDRDQQSLEMIREVKIQLNLSSETEALRAIIRLGHLQVTRLFR